MHFKDSGDIARGTIEQLALAERVFCEQQLIFERAATGILFTKDRHIQRCNPAFEAIFGWEHNHMQGLPTRVMYATDQAWADNGALVYPSLSEHGRFDGELCYCNRQGEPHLVQGDGQLGPSGLKGGRCRLAISERASRTSR